jgi:sarcosine oxidase
MIYDVIIVGLGGAGSAAAMHIAARGRSVLGIEQFEFSNDRGSSHGKSRVIRKAYFEDERYVPLLTDSYRLWRELEHASGSDLLTITGGLNIGPADHPCIQGVEQSAIKHRLPYERIDADALRARWPMLRVTDNDVAIYEADAGVLVPELAVGAHIAEAQRMGAELISNTRVEVIETGAELLRVHAEGREHLAKALVLATGAWSTGKAALLPLELPLSSERQMQLWFDAKPAEEHRADRLSLLIRFFEDRSYYALPDIGDGVKACRHHGGEYINADVLDREVRDADVEDVRAFLRRTIPGADVAPREARACMYTNSPDDHFVIGPHPLHAKVWVATGFSGHGFKFMPVIGKALSELVVDGHTAHVIELFHPNR